MVWVPSKPPVRQVWHATNVRPHSSTRIVFLAAILIIKVRISLPLFRGWLMDQVAFMDGRFHGLSDYWKA